MVKPIGPQCNLNCTYCYYTEKEDLYRPGTSFRMPDEVLEIYIRDYLASQASPEVNFMWQGGEPTLLGVDYFRRLIELQQLHCPPGKTVRNSLQTNGTILDEEWAGFLADNDFLVGISIDGPRRLHDRFRVDKKGQPTFEKVAAAIRLLLEHGVQFNTLTTVHRRNAKFGAETYRFLRDAGVRYMQFIPIVERRGADGGLTGPPDSETDDGVAKVSSWSVPAAAYGDFMCAVFDTWIKKDVGTVFVQMIDVYLGLWLGEPAGLCVAAETCGQNLVLEHNGDLYACDHYVYEPHNLGNIAEKPLAELAVDPRQRKFGADKHVGLPSQCQTCRYLFVCNGGCPKQRFSVTRDGEMGLNYLCPSYKKFATHTEPAMRRMAALLQRGQPAAGIMDILANEKPCGGRETRAKRGRNALCFCGSGKKFKNCCGAGRG